ncbi:hypothetical protein IV203_000824 [Nitzschia inconspicua]|uniref:Uncharacterized protein n=1 Tax=Nitzschia inconspicua TaxID=303405 RepID=A0A9K3L5U9_9STRA|nr:hypothetical protein IV203_000824 [Nitzschia inconspicua]
MRTSVPSISSPGMFQAWHKDVHVLTASSLTENVGACDIFSLYNKSSCDTPSNVLVRAAHSRSPIIIGEVGLKDYLVRPAMIRMSSQPSRKALMSSGIPFQGSFGMLMVDDDGFLGFQTVRLWPSCVCRCEIHVCFSSSFCERDCERKTCEQQQMKQH